jgi:thioredoxin 1
MAPTVPPTRWRLACLCAAWCRLCDAYEPVLRQVAAEWGAVGGGLQLHWIDIEDEAELVGDFEVETFPTLVVLDDDRVRFAGPLTPQADTLRRVLRATIDDLAPDAAITPVGAEVEAFAARLRARVAGR